MYRNRALLLLIGFSAAALIPHIVFGAGVVTPSSGWSIVPAACNCPGGAAGWGCLIQVISNLVQFAIYLGVIISVFMVAYAGFLWVLNPINPENRTTGRKLLINAAIGLVLTLAAWIIVNTVLTVVGVAGGISGSTSVLGGGSNCTTGASSGTTGGPPSSVTTTPGGGGGTGANCPAADPSTMVAIPSQDVVGGTGLATPATVQNYLAMRAAALKAGFDLKVTSAYRSEATQVQLWNANPNPSVVAKPCSLGGSGSNHNSGQALDLTDGCTVGSTCNSPAYNWLKANGGQWNFYNALPTDPVHWSPTGH